MDGVIVSSSAAVLRSSRHVAAAAAVVDVLLGAAVSEAETIAVPAAVSASTAAAETGLAVLCLGGHVHPQDGFLFSFLRGPHRFAHLFPGSCHHPKGLQLELRFSAQSLTGSSPC